MKIEISNWWILWAVLFVLVTAAGDALLVNQFKCNIYLGKYTLYLGRCLFETIAGIMGIFIGIGLMKKGRIKIHQ